MALERVDALKALGVAAPGERTLVTDMNVGGALTIEAMVAGARMVFRLVSYELAESHPLPVDFAKITLTIRRKRGRGARVAVQADDSIRIERPPKVG